MIKRDDYIKIGKIYKRHGVKGNFIISLDKLNFDFFEVAEEIIFLDLLNGDLLPIKVIDYNEKNSSEIIINVEKPFNDYNNDFYIDKDVYINKSIIQTENTYYTNNELINWEILIKGKNLKGIIKDTFETKGNTVLICDFQNKEVMIPLHNDLISMINQDKKTIEFDLPDGLIEAND